MSKPYRLQRAQLVPCTLEEVFPFFADAANLEALTPDFLKFKILTPPPIEMRPGTLIDYELRLYGKGLKWQSRIEWFEANVGFIDMQTRGPYKSWHHTHRFFECDEGTLIVDDVLYEIPLGPVGTLARKLFVRRSLEKIFDFRWGQVEKRFGTVSLHPEVAQAT